MSATGQSGLATLSLRDKFSAPGTTRAHQSGVDSHSRDGIAMEIPKKFGRYEIVDLIAICEAPGIVYKARDPDAERQVMLLVRPVPEGSPEARLRWLGKQKRQCSFRHANIVMVYEVGELEGSAYMAMEFLDGEPLDSVIRKGTPLSLLQRIDIVSQVSDALQFVHDHDVVHLEVRPGHVILSRDGKAKLVGLDSPFFRPMDMGIAYPWRPIIGRIAYMAPEQLNGQELDRRADIFSLGLTCHELVEGRSPFEGDSSVDVVKKILGEPPRPSQKARELHLPELQRVFDKALAKQRDARYQSCAEFSRDLDRVRERLEFEPRGRVSTWLMGVRRLFN
jgi:serine/threonine protein kinase